MLLRGCSHSLILKNKAIYETDIHKYLILFLRRKCFVQILTYFYKAQL